MTDPTLDAALGYADMGVYVFPCNGKEPRLLWRDQSTTDTDTIRRWWARWPGSGIGVDCGKSGLVVPDLDVKDNKDGPGEWKRHINGRDMPATFYVRTPSMGWHLWFRDPDGRYRNSSDQIATGIDIRAVGGYVLAPGSPGYTWHAEAPLSLNEIPVIPDGIIPVSTGRGTGHWAKLDRDALDPRDLAALEALEALGGHDAYLSDGHVAVVRPGKKAGASASIGHIGPGVVKVFTPNWPPLRAEAVYDADQLNQLATGGEGTSASRRIRLTPASAIKPRPVRWTWTSRIPAGELTLTPGRGGIGKSTFHVWTIAHLTRGTLPGVHFGTPKPCIIAAAEDSWARTIVPRLIAAGADMQLVYRVDVVTETDDGVSISLPRDVDGLIEEIGRVGAALLSVDPVMSVISYALDSHKDADVRQALTPLARLADTTGCAVLGNAHFNKSTGSDPLSLVMGSAAFGNVARAALGFARDTEADDGTCVISQVKNNLGRLDLSSLKYRIDEAIIDTDDGPAEVGKLVMLGESDRTVADILRDKGTDEDKAERNEVDQWLIDYLTDRGRKALAAEVIAAAKRAGFNENVVKKARIRIKATSERTGFGRDAFYTWVLMDSMDSQSQKPGTHGIHEESMEATRAGEMGVCAACGQPMYVVEDGQTTHPMCEDTT